MACFSWQMSDMANIKQEAKKVYTLRLSNAEYEEIISFGGWKLYDGVKFLLDYIGKNQNVIHFEAKRNTIWEDIWPKRNTKSSKRNTNWEEKEVKRNTIWNLNDIIDRVMGDTPIPQEKVPTPRQAIQIREIDKLTSWGVKTYWEDGEEYTREQLMKRASLQEFL